jgi:hypothetical protein
MVNNKSERVGRMTVVKVMQYPHLHLKELEKKKETYKQTKMPEKLVSWLKTAWKLK